jgi:hypothetical protein
MEGLTDDRWNWLSFVAGELLKGISEETNEKKARELFKRIGHAQGCGIAKKVGKDTTRATLDKIFAEIAPVCSFKVHSVNITKSEIVVNAEIPACLLRDILRSKRLLYPSPACEIINGTIEKVVLDKSNGREVIIDRWKSDLEDKCFAKITVRFPEEWYTDDGTDEIYWKD